MSPNHQSLQVSERELPRRDDERRATALDSAYRSTTPRHEARPSRTWPVLVGVEVGWREVPVEILDVLDHRCDALLS